MTRRSLLVTVTLLAAGLSAAWLAVRLWPGDPPAEPGAVTVELGELPEMRLGPAPAVGAAQAKRIRGLIAALAELDQPDLGLSAALSGGAFAPLPGQGRVDALLLGAAGHGPSEAMQALVRLGPDALPFLLDALDDPTPTRLTIKHEGFFSATWHGGELPLNPVNPAERGAVGRAARLRRDGPHVGSHRLKVGDVCFVAIGQIVGRQYQAVRYQPTACVVLNCPAHDARLCASVRAIWRS
jgi:hypothetical protein